MGKLNKIEKHLNQNLNRSIIEFDNIDQNNADFTITNKNKNISGKISIDNNQILINEVITNYNKKYLKTILSKGLQGINIPFQHFEKTFSVGDIVFLNENETNLNTISNFSYYGFNETTDCKERICNQTLNVTFLGVVEILCRGTNVRQLAKYRII